MTERLKLKHRWQKYLLLFWIVFQVISLSAQQSNCIDLTDLNASYIHCTYGNFYNPYAHQGIVPGRHSVITNQSSTDPQTNYHLQMIPPGESYSIKLGNENVGAEAESISVDIAVDTNNFDLLILKYAAVMEDPNHTPANQPRFTFDILNTQNQPIDPNCLSADFIANASLGWNSCFGGSVLWKDWTNVGVDISDFHGRTIRVRLTTYDCEQTGHFGYAYFLLSCGHKHISIDVCGDVEQYTYSAPSGFNYNWFWHDTPGQTLSTNQTVSVPAGGNRKLSCHVSFIGNSSCGFDLSTTTEYRFPLSKFSVEETNCQQVLHFVDESFVSNDGVTPDGTGNHCDDIFWSFGDGQTSYNHNPSHKYELPGDYLVMMVAGLNSFECSDTTYKHVWIPENTLVDTLVCDAFVWNYHTYTQSGEYSHNYTTSGGCDSLVTVHLTVAHEIATSFSTVECDEYLWNGETYNLTGQYTQNFSTLHGCDSIVTMNLEMGYTPDFVIQGNHWPIGGTELEWTQYPYQIVFNNPLCVADSISWSIDCPTMFVFPEGEGMSCNLRIFSYLSVNDSVPLHAVVYNRCGEREYTIWIHTTYYDLDENHLAGQQISVFPNPNPGVFRLVMDGLPGEVEVVLMNAQGMLMDRRTIVNGTNHTTTLYDISRLPNGIYTIRVTHKTGVINNKLLIQK